MMNLPIRKNEQVFRVIGCISIIFASLFPTLASAQQKWVKIIDFGGGEAALSVKPTLGGYVVTGFTSMNYVSRAFLLKLDANGNELWRKFYADNTAGYCVEPTNDGGYIISGDIVTTSFYTGLYLLKVNSTGDTVWSRIFDPTSSFEGGYSVCQTSDGGYMSAGWQGSYYDIYIVKTDAAGNLQWQRTYDLPDYGLYHKSLAAQQTQDGGYMVATGSWIDYMDKDFVLLKTDANGNLQFLRYYGTTGIDSIDEGRTGVQTQDGGYILFGARPRAYPHLYIIKTNASGDTVWSKQFFGIAGPGYTTLYSSVCGQQTSDGGFIALSIMRLLKLGPNGDSIWCQNYWSIIPGATGYWVEETPDHGYVFCGRQGGSNTGNIFVVKTDSMGNVGVVEDTYSDQAQNPHYRCLPNLFPNYTTIKGYEQEDFIVYDVLGNRVGRYRGDRIGEDLPNGVFFIRSVHEPSFSLRVVKIH